MTLFSLLFVLACGTPAPAPAAPQGPTAVEALSKMDTRKPVPLQPMMAWHQKQNMMGHLEAIQKITKALSTEDWDGIAKATEAIAISPEMKMQCEHMGKGAAGFTDQALEFHHRADAITEAAKKKDTTGVLKATAHTLEACTGCHATFRQDVVDAATWEARTGSTLDH